MLNSTRTNKRLVIKLLSISIGMFAFGYLLVPIYNVMCKTLGINGKTGGPVAYREKGNQIDKNRWVTIEFLATNNTALPWKFYPKIKKIKLHPGELKRVSFYGENTTDHSMIVQAIPSITPGIAAKYMKKTECFCFTQQTLNGHGSMDMPILFHIDRALPKNIHTLTLSYTLFDVTKMKLKAKQNAGRIT